MIGFQWCVRASSSRQRMLVSGLIIFLLLFSSISEQFSHAKFKFAAGMVVDASREEARMPRKLNRIPRKTRRDQFQFERLEPRQMFSVSSGLTLEEILARRQDLVVEHQVETPGAPDADPPVGGQAEQGLDNYLFLPMVTPNANGSVQTATPFQLGADVFVNSNVDLTVQWSKVSGPGTATFTDGIKIDSKVQFDQPGTYLLKLEATNKGYSGSGLITVTVTGEVAPVEGDPIAPELFDTTYALPTGGTTHTPMNGTEFQAALNTAQPGDVIVLQAGTTYTGNFNLPKKQGDGWIYIISSKLDQLPVGERVGLEDAGNMPKLVAGNYQLPVIRTDFGAHHYRLAGLEISTEGIDKLDLIRTGYGIPDGKGIWDITAADTADKLPHHITFDRLLLHSKSDTHKLRHGIMLNGEYMAVVDSHIANVKDGSDAQAIWIFQGDGPYKIVNNFLEATGENFMAGGTDPRIPGSVPSDIEFRGNYLFKRLDWKTNPTPNWSIKNLLELKNAQRVLITGNVMENNWADSQTGTAVLFTVRNQNGTAPWSVVQDINFENNIVKNVGMAFNVTAEDNLQSSQQTKRIRIHNNLIEGVRGGDYSSAPAFLNMGALTRPILNLTVTQNTFLSAFDEAGPAGHLGFNSPGVINVDGFTFKDNIMVHGNYGPDWSRVANADIANNVLIMLPNNSRYAWNKSTFGTYHPGWLMADPGFGSVGFVDYLNGNYALSATSPYKNSATNGGAVGANVGALQQVVNQVSITLGTDGALSGLAEALIWRVSPFNGDADSHESEDTLGEPLREIQICTVPDPKYLDLSREHMNDSSNHNTEAVTPPQPEQAEAANRDLALNQLFALIEKRSL